ncbi:MAG TPA: PLP-dependent aminotransferase family protein, partial [Thermoleophilaceae bacterium]|nr:PLP-dependent aminotransferase family protein [Thermoleophilaceae bacterium]
LELLISLDRSRPSLKAQIEDQLRAAVRDKRLTPGSALPSSRGLARELGVSRGVVVEAYSQLVAEGYLVARPGGATRVALAASPGAELLPAPAAERPPRFDFRPGGPDVSLFPRDAWLASLRRALRSAPNVRLDYGDPRGAPELRRALASYLGRVRGAACDPERVIVTSGMAQGMALLGRTLVARGRGRIAVEDPSSGPGREQLASTGLETVPVGVDDEGLRVDLLDGLGRLDAVMVTPAHQFPLGVVLSPARRARLAEWAAERDAIVLEDDYDSEYRYDRAPVGALQGLAPAQVVYAGSVSKTLAPGLRLGWMATPERIAAELVAAKQRDDLGTPVVEQLALADFLERGGLDRHLRRTRVSYRRRRDALVAALARRLPGWEPAGIAAGLHLVALLPPEADEAAVLEAARARGIALSGLSEHSVEPRPPALLLGYGRIAEPAIEPGVAELLAGYAATGRARRTGGSS